MAARFRAPRRFLTARLASGLRTDKIQTNMCPARSPSMWLRKPALISVNGLAITVMVGSTAPRKSVRNVASITAPIMKPCWMATKPTRKNALYVTCTGSGPTGRPGATQARATTATMYTANSTVMAALRRTGTLMSGCVTALARKMAVALTQATCFAPNIIRPT